MPFFLSLSRLAMVAAGGLLLTRGVSAQVPAAPTPVAAPPAFAESARRFWRQAAEMDIDAAWRMLAADHPAAAPEVDDPGFKAALASAHALAAGRARQVTDYDGYAATLTGFGDSFGDAHIRARPLLRPSTLDWPGVLIGYDGDRWRVVDTVSGSPVPAGAVLVGCDGHTADDLGHERLGGFRIDWQVKAQRINNAPWLLVDDHNPFLKRPVACMFETNGVRETVPLAWESIKLPELLARIEAVKPYGAAGFGIRRAGDGYWIALESLLDGAGPVMRAVQARADEIRRAPFVVLDLRGNGGGGSEYGAAIARAILGEAYVKAVSDAAGGCGEDEPYRATAANIARFRQYRVLFGKDRGDAWVKALDKQIADMERARREGRAFSGPVTCRVRPSPKRPPSEYKGKLFIVTDSRCFSSCLIVTDLWRRLGAVQLGRETDANTHYIDVRDTMMPSGMTTFSTQMGLAAGTPMRFGPFVPDHPFHGDIADTAAVERWTLEIANR